MRTPVRHLLAFVFVACASLVGCGGGTPPTTPPATPPATNTAPSVSVVADQSVVEGVLVFLGGAGLDAQGPVSYRWTQTSGPAVTLSDATLPAPSFTAPLVAQDAVLQFRLTVTDSGGATANATTAVTVRDVPPPSASIVTQVLAGQGMPAAGFVPGTVYAEVDALVIGRNGHVAFRGRADTSISPAGQGSAVVWGGLPDRLVPIVVEGDSFDGLPRDVVIGSNLGVPRVTPAGNVALEATLKGTVAPANRGTALLVHRGGVTKKVLSAGDPAPGLPGKTITSPGLIDFSDAGMLIGNAGAAIWYWNTDSTALLAASGQATGLYPNCQFYAFHSAKINTRGDIVVGATLVSTVAGNTACPAQAVFMWRQGVMAAVMDSLQPIPNVPGSQFYLANQPGNQPLPGGVQLTETGGLLFQATSKPTSAYSAWYQPLGETPRLIALQGETVAPLSGGALSLSGNQGFFINENGSVLALVQEGINGHSILLGQPRPTMPYTSMTAPGVSQLSALARIGGRPPGFSASAAYGLFLWAKLNNPGDVLVLTIVQDGLSTTEQTMLYEANGAGQKILSSGQTINFMGAARTLSSPLYGGLSDNRRVISSGKLDGLYDVVLLISY